MSVKEWNGNMVFILITSFHNTQEISEEYFLTTSEPVALIIHKEKSLLCANHYF